MRFIQKLTISMLRNGYEPINGLCKEILDENTVLSGVYRKDGAIIYHFILIDTDRAENYSEIYNSVVKQIRENGKESAVVGIFYADKADERLISYCTVDTDIYSGNMDIRWIVEKDSDSPVIYGSQVSKIIDLNELICKALRDEKSSDEAVSVSSIYDEKKEQYRENIKSKNCFLTYGLIGINILIMLLCYAVPNLSDMCAVSYEKVVGGEWYRLFTYMFMHGGLVHLFGNCFSLYIIGSRAEIFYGKKDFALIYFMSGVIGGLLSVIGNGMGVYAVGASAAICGLLGAVMCYAFFKKTSLGGLDWFTLVIFAIVAVGSGALEEEIDNWGHLGGMLGGILIGILLNVGDKNEKEA